jgi:hypothetical protein
VAESGILSRLRRTRVVQGMILQVALCVAVLVVGAWLRVYRLGVRPLGVDETAVVRDSKQGIPEIWQDSFRAPLQFTTVKLVRILGESETVYRLPSVIAGVAGIAVFMALAGRGLGPHVAPAAGALLAFNEFHIGASREAKYYAFVILCSALCAFFLLRLRQGAGSASLWGFVLSGTAGLYYHGYGAAAVVCQTPFAVWWYVVAHRRRRGVAKSLLPPLVGLMIASAPFILAIVSQRAVGRSGGQLWGTESMDLTDPRYYQELLSVLGLNVGVHLNMPVLLALGTVGLAWRSRGLALLSVVTLAGPLVVAVLVEPMGYQHRYLAFSLPFLLLVLVGLLHMLVRPLASISGGAIAAPVAVGAAVLLGVGGLSPQGLSRPTANWRTLGESLGRRLAPGDVVILPEGGVWMELLERYLGDPEGVDVLASKNLFRWPADADPHGTRWWVLRQPPSRLKAVKERLAEEFETDTTIPGFLLLSRHGTASRADICMEAGLVLEVLTALQTESANVSTWPSRRAHAWTTVGRLYNMGGDVHRARASYERALQEDSTYSAARGALERMARRRKTTPQ